MGMVGKEIIQSRLWVDPKAAKPPDLNYKNVYPVTVYEAVKETMDDNAPTLKDLLDSIHEELASKQPIFSGKPSNYLMTFAGVAGGVGSIAISKDVPWDPTEQRDDRIPTEKAVGTLLMKLGLVDKDGNIDSTGGTKVDWKNVIGRPSLYDGLGTNDDGFITQQGITLAMNGITSQLDLLSTNSDGKFNIVTGKIDSHVANLNNPHHVTIDQLGAVSTESFEFHISNVNNPHTVTKTQVGLVNVDNTSDINKPVSKATQDALDIINKIVQDLNTDLDSVVINGKYDQKSGKLTLTLGNNSTIEMFIPIDGLIDGIAYDKTTKELVATELSGIIHRIDVSDLFIRYLGSVSSNITLTIDDTQPHGNQIVSAIIIPKSITDNEVADSSIITKLIKDQNVTTDKLKDLSVTTIKLSDKSVTIEKLADLAVTTIKIADRAVTGKKLFTSAVDNRILGVLATGSDPVWLQVNTNMIANDAVRTINILSKSVVSDKLDDRSVITRALDDLAVTNGKLADLAVTDAKIDNGTISGAKLINDILFPGTPRIDQRPLDTANNTQVPDTFWVTNKLDKIQVRNDNLITRCVDGRILFSSTVSNKALVVLSANSNPVWALINNGMMGDGSISTNNVIDLSITDPKIGDAAIKSRHITTASVLTDHIKEGAVNSINIWKSDAGNRILASLTDSSHPVYTQVAREMILDNAIGTRQIEDRTVSLPKLVTSDKSNRMLGVVLQNTNPVWMQANNGMLGDSSVDGRVLFRSSVSNRVLVATDINIEPAWLQINGQMIQDRAVGRTNIALSAIYPEHLQENMIESRHIIDRSIKSVDIAQRAITGVELFTSPTPNRILGVTTSPYANPDWMQVATDMVADQAITKEKIFQSRYSYTVLGSTQDNVPPEYLKITSDFIVDDSIIPSKLIRDFILFGTPEITEHPPADSENRQIADTYWVRKTIASIMKDFNPEILFDVVTPEMIPDHGVAGTKLFTYDHAPRVLGITEPNGVAEYILIEEDLIVDGAVTKNKLQRDITLLGSPNVEVRPFAGASDAMGGGNLIPDCQWVLDTIGTTSPGGSGGGTAGIPNYDPEYFVVTAKGLSLNVVNILSSRGQVDDLFTSIGTGGTGTGTGTGTGSGGDVGYESITTDNLANRAVIGDKMFSSLVSNRLLGVLEANSSPQYIQAVNDMIGNRAINGRTLFTSPSANKVLAVITPGSDPAWLQINYEMMDKDSVGTYQLIDDSVINAAIADKAVDGRTLFSSPIANRILGVLNVGADPVWLQVNSDMVSDNSLGSNHLRSDSVTTPKLVDYSVTQIKLDRAPIIDTIRIVDKSVTSIKVADQGIENQNILDHTIQGGKLVNDIVLPGLPSVNASTSYQTRSLRNTIISSDAPSGGENGDIWLRYI